MTTALVPTAPLLARTSDEGRIIVETAGVAVLDLDPAAAGALADALFESTEWMEGPGHVTSPDEAAMRLRESQAGLASLFEVLLSAELPPQLVDAARNLAASLDELATDLDAAAEANTPIKPTVATVQAHVLVAGSDDWVALMPPTPLPDEDTRAVALDLPPNALKVGVRVEPERVSVRGGLLDRDERGNCSDLRDALDDLVAAPDGIGLVAAIRRYYEVRQALDERILDRLDAGLRRLVAEAEAGVSQESEAEQEALVGLVLAANNAIVEP